MKLPLPSSVSQSTTTGSTYLQLWSSKVSFRQTEKTETKEERRHALGQLVCPVAAETGEVTAIALKKKRGRIEKGTKE